MIFRSKWIDWQPSNNVSYVSESTEKNSNNVSNVSSSPIGIETFTFSPKHIKNQLDRKKDRSNEFKCPVLDKSTDAYTRLTDKTDNKPRPLIFDGHRVVKVIWKLPHGAIFQDETGAIWRYLECYETAWPVIISNGVN